MQFVRTSSCSSSMQERMPAFGRSICPSMNEILELAKTGNCGSSAISCVTTRTDSPRIRSKALFKWMRRDFHDF